MDQLLTELGTQATTIAGHVSTAAVLGVGVGIVGYGIKRVWRAFRSM